jgi:DHA3 family macrolide efflux protein-like MFS transporter
VPGGLDLSGVTSLLAVVVVIAFFAGIAYGLVAIPAQTQLQEDLPEDVRGRVFGVLGMLVSVASFLPIIIVGPISDLVGTTAVIFVMAIGVVIVGVVSVVTRGPLLPTQARPASHPNAVDPIATALTWSHPEADAKTVPAQADAAPAPEPAPQVAPVPVVTLAVPEVASPEHAGESDPTDPA